MSFENELIALFAVATAVALAARLLKMPYTAALVLAGLGLGFTHAINPPHLTKALLYAVFLPGLLFEAAFHLEFKRFWGNIVAIGSLSVPGVVASGLLIALLLSAAVRAFGFTDGFHFGHALAFGALICATDPIAVVALFKTLGVPRRLAMLVESESLINDGTAVAFYGVVLASVGGTNVSIVVGVLQFLRIAGLGLVVGGAVGFAIAHVIRRVDDPMIEITLTTIAAYGSFVAAESIHASGVIATVTAGMLCGNYAARSGMTATTRMAVESFWEYVAFGLNSLVFLLIGLEVHIEELARSWRLILVVFAIVTIVRALLVFAITGSVRYTKERMPWSWAVVLGWGGLRGALSMVLALSLPEGFPHRAIIVTMTFGVVVLSILLQGLTMSPLLRALGIVLGGEPPKLGLFRSKAMAARAALDALELTSLDELPSETVTTAVRQAYSDAFKTAEAELSDTDADRSADDVRARRLRRRLILVERDALMEAHRSGLIDRGALADLLCECDERLLALQDASSERD